jgi:hypothetical protein
MLQIEQVSRDGWTFILAVCQAYARVRSDDDF